MGKKLLLSAVVFMAVSLCSSAVFALDPMGPPAAGLKEGQFSIGVDYSDSEMDIKLDDGHSSDSLYKLIGGNWVYQPQSSSSSRIDSVKIKHLDLHKVYANLGYGITKDWEAFLRLGAMNADFKVKMFPLSSSEEHSYDGDTGFAIGFGTKTTFYQDGDLKIGGLFQISWGESEAKLTETNLSEKVEIRIIEAQLAVGPTYQLTEDILIYGGPFWHFIHFCDSDVHGKRSKSLPAQDELLIDKTSYDIDDISHFGGYIGLQYQIAKNLFYYIEYQHTKSADAIAMNLTWKF